MATVRTYKSSFNGGEIAPEAFGRIEDAKYQGAVAKLRNFIALPHGPATNRPGFQFVRAVRDVNRLTRLIPFTFSTTQTYVIEFGAGYFRFHTFGATVMSGGFPYEVVNTYTEAELFDVHYVQSADVLTLVHPNHPPRELRRTGATTWVLTDIAFSAPIAAPSSVSVAAVWPTPGAGYTYSYCVTAVTADGAGESVASAVVNVNNNLFQTGASNTISWGAVAGASRYRVYKVSGGLYGYIGQTTTTSLIDDNIAADISRTPPIYDALFSGAGDYPSAVSYFEQRRVFAGTNNKPQNLWMTRSGTESNLSYSIPVRDDDRIAFRVAAREANVIRHAVPLSTLVLLTSAAEWRVTSVNTDALTPTSTSVRPQSYVGANNAQPVIVNNNLIYAAARGGHVRELAYNWQANGYVTGDLSLRAPHLFDGLDITDMAYSKAPEPVCWFVSSSGKLLGLTYVPEQQVGAWHQHDTDGAFESICVVAEGSEDRLYAVVRRTVNGATVRYVERMSTRLFAAQSDAFFVDSGLTYTGTPVSTISGLGHLEGKVVSVLADGAVHPQRTVSGGTITLDNEASVVTVGLPIQSDIQTLPPAVGVDAAYGMGRVRNVNRVVLRVNRSGGIFAGPDADHLTEAKLRTTEPMGTPPMLKSDEVEIVLTPSWGASGQVYIRQNDPLPLTVVSVTAEVAMGG